jgi:DNA-binding NarL/FixJ family response regulator
MLKILVADDHAIVRKGVIQILRDEFPTAEISDVSNAEDLIQQVIAADWDIVITDLSMPGRSGLEALKQIKLSKPSLPVLILSMHPEEHYAVRVLKAGASGYLNKEAAPDELVKAVNLNLKGKKYINEATAEAMASNLTLDNNQLPHQLLSDRELEVMKLIAIGYSISEISEKLSLSVTTVSTYRTRILAKLQIKTNASLILYALENKLC